MSECGPRCNIREARKALFVIMSVVFNTNRILDAGIAYCGVGTVSKPKEEMGVSATSRSCRLVISSPAHREGHKYMHLAIKTEIDHVDGVRGLVLFESHLQWYAGIAHVSTSKQAVRPRAAFSRS